MTKNKYISLLLLFVLLFVLVHNVIPHHHYDDVSEIINHEHDHNHNHDKKDNDHHNENDEPNSLFSHATHFFTSTEFIFKVNNHSINSVSFNQLFLTSELVPEPIRCIKKRKPPNGNAIIPLRLFYYNHSLRGPPVFSV